MPEEPVFDPRLTRPLGVFACVAIGLAAGRWATPAPAVMLGISVVLAALALARPRGAFVAVLLALAVVTGSAGWWTVRVEHAPARALLDAAGRAEGRPIVEVEGTVADAPRAQAFASGPFARFAAPGVYTSWRLAGARLVGDSDPGRRGVFWIRVTGEAPSVNAGDRVRVIGRLTPAGRRANPGDPPYRLLALGSGTAGFVSAPSAGSVRVLEHRAGVRGRLGAWRARLRARATAWLGADATADTPAAAVLRAALIGERTRSLDGVDRAVRRIGVAHLLAISGLHLTFLVMLGVLGLRLVRDPGRLGPILAAALVVAYLFLTPPRAPIVRAGGVTLALLAGEALGTRWHRVALLAWAATLTVLWHPLELFSAGFQLSYGCVTALVLFQRPLVERLFGRSRHPGIFKGVLINAVVAALIAWLAATPILAYHTGVVNPLGPVVVVLMTPVFTVMLAVGFIASAVSLLSPLLGAVVGGPALEVAALFARLALTLERVPLMTAHLPTVPFWLTAAALAGVVWWLWAPKRAFALAGAVLILSAAVFAVFSHASRAAGLAPGVALRVDMLDVADGSCTLVRSGSEAMLWDCGSSRSGIGQRTVPRSVRALGAWRVRSAALSHANLDHYGGFPDAAKPIGLRTLRVTVQLLDEAAADPGGPVAELIELLRRDGVEIRPASAGEEFPFGGARVRVLWPPASASFEKTNNASMVLLVSVPTTAGERTVLLTGDIEVESARAILSANPGLRADVLELPHHGSARLSGTGVVGEIDPRVVLQSTGPSRVGDERWDAARSGRVWLTTAERGAVWAEILRTGEVRSGALR